MFAAGWGGGAVRAFFRFILCRPLRPANRAPFLDVVSGKYVQFWRDEAGMLLMSTNRWGFGAVYCANQGQDAISEAYIPKPLAYIAPSHENLFIYSMMGPFRVVAVFADQKEAIEFSVEYNRGTTMTGFGPLFLVTETIDPAYGATP